jgi:hypothetical protein
MMRSTRIRLPSGRFQKPICFAASLLFMLMFSTLGGAQSVPQSPPAPAISPATQYLSQRLHPGVTLENYLQQIAT